MSIGSKKVGLLLIVFALVLLLTLTFVKAGLDAQSIALCDAFEEDMESCPAHNSNTSWFLTGAFGLSFLVLGFGGYLTFMPKPAPVIVEQKKVFKEIDMARLDEDERKLYEIIKARGGSAFQSELIRELGLSKVKVTRILDKLEMSQILERKRRGMTNIIVLK
ncbi:MAG TPA: hypothetical protein VJ110_02555 [Candidatus Nanoarchaeia archaeon]|nr:hypothetical protein [Candidatus Nanoarchaeia archaeon]